jgi:hypothetical protein
VAVLRATYGSAEGPTAVMLTCGDLCEPLATLSVNMYRPDCSHDSKDLPPDCFYVKAWSENEEIAEEAFASGLFVNRDDLPQASSGFVSARVWQIKATRSAA